MKISFSQNCTPPLFQNCMETPSCARKKNPKKIQHALCTGVGYSAKNTYFQLAILAYTVSYARTFVNVTRRKSVAQSDRSLYIQAKEPFQGLDNSVPAVCLNLPATFSQPGNGSLADPCTIPITAAFLPQPHPGLG